jgi:hypothetical protein
VSACTPESLRDARAALDALGKGIEQLGKSPSPKLSMDGVPGTHIEFRPHGTSYELLFSFDLRTTLGIGRCGAYAFADRATAERVGLEDRSDLKSWQQDFRYTPQFGLFLVERPNLILARAVRRALPSDGGAAFTVNGGASCTESERGAVELLLRRLQHALSAASPLTDETFHVVPHEAKQSPWFEVTFPDQLLLVPFLDCANIASATEAELQQRSIGGSRPPAVNYSPNTGWYVVR